MIEGCWLQDQPPKQSWPLPINQRNHNFHTDTSLAWEMLLSVLWAAEWEAEREMLKYLINDSQTLWALAWGLKAWATYIHWGCHQNGYLWSRAQGTQETSFFSFLFAFELTAYLEIFQNYFNLSFSVLSHATQNVHPQYPKGHRHWALNRESIYRRVEESRYATCIFNTTKFS